MLIDNTSLWLVLSNLTDQLKLIIYFEADGVLFHETKFESAFYLCFDILFY